MRFVIGLLFGAMAGYLLTRLLAAREGAVARPSSEEQAS
jgi:hypothetical protein